jgi:hypothetical protein
MVTLCMWHKTKVACDPSPYLADNGANDHTVSHGVCSAHADYMRVKAGLPPKGAAR